MPKSTVLTATTEVDTVTTTVRLAEKIDAKKRIRFEVESKNQNGETVMIGELLEQCL